MKTKKNTNAKKKSLNCVPKTICLENPWVDWHLTRETNKQKKLKVDRVWHHSESLKFEEKGCLPNPLYREQKQ